MARANKEESEGHKETFGGDGYTYYLDYGDGFMGLFINKNLSNCTSVYTLYYKSIVPQ